VLLAEGVRLNPQRTWYSTVISLALRLLLFTVATVFNLHAFTRLQLCLLPDRSVQLPLALCRDLLDELPCTLLLGVEVNFKVLRMDCFFPFNLNLLQAL